MLGGCSGGVVAGNLVVNTPVMADVTITVPAAGQQRGWQTAGTVSRADNLVRLLLLDPLTCTGKTGHQILPPDYHTYKGL